MMNFDPKLSMANLINHSWTPRRPMGDHPYTL